MGETLTVRIWRGDAAGGGFAAYEAPRRPDQTVLDVVAWVQQNVEPALGYRFACRVGMCGSCAMTVNGRPRWTCRTHVDKVVDADTLEVAPLANFPVIRDLAVDMEPFFDKWREVGVFDGDATRDEEVAAIPPDTPEREEADAGIECINCAVCYAACDTVANDPDFLGPAALNRAWTLVNDAKADQAGALAAATRPGGCLSCHSMGNCAAHCPNDLNPLRAIAGLKRAAMRAAWRR